MSKTSCPDDIVKVVSSDGMAWYIISMEEGRKTCHYVINRRYRNGSFVIEKRTYRSFSVAMEAVRKQKEKTSYAVLHEILHGQ